MERTLEENILILGLAISLLKTKPIYLSVKEYIKLLKWKIELSLLNESEKNNNEETVKLLLSKLNAVIIDWIQLKSVYTINNSKRRKLDDSLFVSISDNQSNPDKTLSSIKPIQFIKDNKETLYQFSLYFSKLISQLLTSTKKKSNNKNNDPTNEKKVNDLNEYNKNLNEYYNTKTRNNIEMNSKKNSNNESHSSESIPSPSTILPMYAIELFFKYFFDQFLIEFNSIEQSVVSDNLIFNIKKNGSTSPFDLFFNDYKYSDNITNDNSNINFSPENISLSDSFGMNCQSKNKLYENNSYHDTADHSDHDNNFKNFDYSNNKENCVDIMETLNILEIIFYSLQELLIFKKEYTVCINKKFKKVVRLFIKYLKTGIQYLYGKQFYHHDIHSQLYHTLLKIESLILQISKSSCTLYLYTLTLLFRECRMYIFKYFYYVEMISNLKEETEENEDFFREEDILENNKDNYFSSSIKQENNLNIDNFNFNFLCVYETLSCIFSLFDEIIQSENIYHFKKLSLYENIQQLQYFFSIELNQFISDYQRIIKEEFSIFSSNEKNNYSFYFKSYSFPYQNLIKLNMIRILERFKVIQNDWNESNILKTETIQCYNNNNDMISSLSSLSHFN
ncbi:hypothetical protein BCR36DRAFT_408771 [Piromyces finnis]|uniref:Uncharacterized protein n=1 Tax=Piromyces finnis TaxID=1754191 RepID=A0A1Y1VLD7_9FUNG|nr:hypothetical protein BCR36DRAFT_408771 [Piromyces finnis]|eukprot:ORX59270.1 hypothetical protein BCR36DRAFT_408771 [Piromyces finnis]